MLKINLNFIYSIDIFHLIMMSLKYNHNLKLILELTMRSKRNFKFLTHFHFRSWALLVVFPWFLRVEFV